MHPQEHPHLLHSQHCCLHHQTNILHVPCQAVPADYSFCRPSISDLDSRKNNNSYYVVDLVRMFLINTVALSVVKFNEKMPGE